MLEARAFWVTAPGHGEIRVQRLRSPAPGELLIRACRSAISRGSESLVFRGEVPESEWQRMRCPFQEGDFPAPVKYGYSAVGIVEDGPAEALGRRVFCLHPHQDRFIVPKEAVVDVPDAVPDRRATLAANMETAINGMWDAAPGPGDRIAVIGAGVVGCLVAALAARLPGAEVELIDIDPTREAIAAAFGCHFATPEKASPEADLVVHASGSPAGLAAALTIAGLRGDGARNELVWHPNCAARTGRCLSFPPPDLAFVAGRFGFSGPIAALVAPAPPDARPFAAARPCIRYPALRRNRIFCPARIDAAARGISGRRAVSHASVRLRDDAKSWSFRGAGRSPRARNL